MEINVPELSLIVLVGTSGSGKSTFAQNHFEAHEVVSSDGCRGIVSNDENNQAATKDAFDLLHYIVGKRLKNGLLTVVDATSVQADARKSLIELARSYHALPIAIVLDIPEKVCRERNIAREDRTFGSHVIRRQRQQLKHSLRGLKREGFSRFTILKSVEEVDAVTGIARAKLYNDKKDIHGPFDIIGDIHGCYDETVELLKKLGYGFEPVSEEAGNYGLSIQHPEGRQAIFVGDLVDRGPASPAVLKLVMSMVHSGSAHCVPGNHDVKLMKKLNGRKVQLKHGLAETMEQLSHESPEFLDELRSFLRNLISHYVFDNGRLVVAHAGLKEEMQGRGSGAVRSFCLYGETTGEIDEFGLPVRHNWAAEYRGSAKVVYGHTPVPTAEWLNRTIDIDTGCVFGGELTALRYPEEELVSVPAQKVYCEPVRPLEASPLSGLNTQQEYDDILDIADVTGKRIVQTRLRNNITIREENSIAALEVMSRWAMNPKWLIYLPPTMSPCETSALPDHLEHPAEAIAYYKERGIEKVICEEKHMGSRAVLVLCKDEATALERFGIEEEGAGVCFTRTGRNFFTDSALEKAFIDRVIAGLTKAGFWEQMETDWVCLDAELMPWSAKAQALIRKQYASVGAAAQPSLAAVETVLQKTLSRGIEGVDGILEKFSYKKGALSKYVDAYRHYCWEVNSLDDYKLAPFHILATEGKVHTDKDHVWHMETIKSFCQADEQLFLATPYRVVDTTDEASVQAAMDWWMELTGKGGEGMVVKPFDFVTHGKKGMLQPAVKCRGSEYLRIIYGPEYDLPQHMRRLKRRNLSRKRSLALREFSLGVEGLERFVRKEPLRRIHESVFAVLALESEEVDPRL